MKNIITCLPKKVWQQEGFVASLTTILVLVFMLSIAMSMSLLTMYRQRISTNTITATQSYYTAQAGAEDALLRLKNNNQISTLSYTLTINNSTATVGITTDSITGSKTINSQGSNNSLIKTLQVVYGIDNSKISFYYGVGAGDGGIQNNGTIHGNVFSSGPITGGGTIDNNVVLSSKTDGTVNSITGVTVGGNVLAHNCVSPAKVLQNLTYVTGGTHTCTVQGTTSVQSSEISSQPLPIPQSQIDSWKSEAAGSVFSGTKNITTSQSLGPLKITGDLNISSGATLTLTGTLYVVGNINIDNNNTKIQLDNSYGSSGGVIISDGTFNVNHPNIALTGSGITGSYLLILSTNTSDQAIWIKNNLTGNAAFYTSAGGITLTNNVSVVEATGYKIIMNNGSTIQYSVGVVNIYFSSGPGGGWKVLSWQEK